MSAGRLRWIALGIVGGLWAGGSWAQDATWLANPATDIFNSGGNWSSGTVPIGVATFGASNTTSILIDGPFFGNTISVGALQFDAEAPVYTIFPDRNLLRFTGAGIVNNSSTPQHISDQSLFVGGTVEFLSGTAADTIFTIKNGTLSFRNGSSAGSATINTSSVTQFHDSSTAGTAAIFITNNGDTDFLNSSTAGNATISNANGRVIFLDTSTAANARITTNAGGIMVFAGNATAANAALTVIGDVDHGSTLQFLNSATAANATIILQGQTLPSDPAFQVGVLQISGGTLGNAQVTADFGGNLQMLGSSSAGQGTITVNNGGLAQFRQSSTGDQARFVGTTGASFDISGMTGAGFAMGSLEGTGTFFLGAKALTLGSLGTSTTFAGTLSDDDYFGNPIPGGSLTKVGAGALTLTGVSTYSGGTLVSAGTLNVNGSLVSSVTVDNGGTLIGNGTIGGLAVLGGGVVAPGNSIGTLTVNGPVSFAAGSIYQVQLNAAGANDKIVATGSATLTGGTVQVLASPGNYRPSTTYTILTATGGVTGTFTGVTSNFAFLTPTLTYDANNVFLILLSSGSSPVNFCSAAVTRNQCSTATAVQAGGAGSTLYNAVIAQSPEGARQAFDALSGEIHGSLQSSLVDDSRYVRHAVLSRPLRAPRDESSTAFWTEALGAWGRFESDGNAATTTRSLGGILFGADRRFGEDWLAGIAAGYSHARVNVDARSSAADIDSVHVAAYLGAALAAVNFRAGGAYSWHTIATARSILFPGFADTAHANYSGGTGQVFGEVGYGVTVGSVALEPFGGLAWVKASTNGFSEAGGAAALAGSGNSLDVGYSTLGMRAAAQVALDNGMTLMPRASALWQHALGNVTPGAALAFRSTGQGFAITGAPMAQDSALIDAGLDLQLNRQVRLGIGYVGQLAGNVADHSVNARLRWIF